MDTQPQWTQPPEAGAGPPGWPPPSRRSRVRLVAGIVLALVLVVAVSGFLIGYAAKHTSWDGVGPTVQKLSATTGRQITLTTTDRVPIISTSASTEPLPQRESTVVDALHTEAALQPGTSAGIDPKNIIFSFTWTETRG